jgi:outer membrane protein OmpA-like peptidoglycan-associated protein
MKPRAAFRATFLASMTCVVALAACSQQPPSAPEAAAAQAVTANAPSDVEVFFDDGSSALTAESNQRLDQAARLYREGNPAIMFVTGHADSTGAEFQNLVLSGQRAEATKEALVARGIPPDRLQLQALGSSLPVDPSATAPDNNRRVVITWR